MSLYDITYNYIANYIFNNAKLTATTSTIMGESYTMAEWLSHTTTIVCMLLIVALLIKMVIWLFKQVSNTFNVLGTR